MRYLAIRRFAIRSTFIALTLTSVPLGETPASSTVSSMHAIVYHNFGGPDVLRLERVEKPVPNDDHVLIKVHAAALNPLDWHYMEGTPYVARLMGFGLRRPSRSRLGVDFSGTVEAVGRNVTEFKPGDEVFGGAQGALAEYICVSADRAIVSMPSDLSFEQAASIPIAGVTALQALRDSGQIKPGHKVLINGASGGVGTFAVQLAKWFGAEVTGVCSTRNIELVRSLGADHVIDYTKEDFTQGEPRYDIVLDNVANRSLLECRRTLNPSGRYVLVGGGGVDDGRWAGPLIRPVRAMLLSLFVRQDLGMVTAALNKQDLAILRDLVQTGTITPAIDRHYRLSETVEAMRYLETGRARGKVVIAIAAEDLASAAHSEPATSTRVPIRSNLIALTLLTVVVGVPVAPVVLALVLNRRLRQRYPGQKPFRWGYYFSIMSLVRGVGLGLLLQLGIAATLICGGLYAVLAWFFAQRRRWAWVTLTLLSFSPIAWLINFVYLRKRWAETGPSLLTTPQVR